MSKLYSPNLRVQVLETDQSREEYNKAYAELGPENPYYCLELLKSVETDQKLQCFYFYQDNQLKALMPFNLRKIFVESKETGYYDVSSPYGYNGPLFKKGLSVELKNLFWNTIDKWYKENKVVSEFLRFNFTNNYTEYTGAALHTLKNVKGDIRDFDKVWSNLKSSTRNQYRKAEKEGLTFEIHYKEIPEEKIKNFYGLYIGTMNRRQASDAFYHKLDYFKDFCSNHRNRVAIGLVYSNSVPISGEFFLISDDTLYSYLGGTDADYFKLRPNEYLKITAVKWAGTIGLNYYLIGGGQADGDNLYLYKKKYFPYDDDVNFFTGRKIINKYLYKDLIKNAEPNDLDITDLSKGFFPKYREV